MWTWVEIAAAIGAVTIILAILAIGRFLLKLVLYPVRQMEADDNQRAVYGDVAQVPRILSDEEIDAEWDKHYGTRSL